LRLAEARKVECLVGAVVGADHYRDQLGRHEGSGSLADREIVGVVEVGG
jgi:hypothetical protein